MRRHMYRVLTVGAIGVLAALLPAPAASAGTTHGPYEDHGFCSYLMYGVRAGGHDTSDCYQPCGAGCTAPNGDTGWYFHES